MSDFDRGAYTPPTDDPLAFDARMTRQRRPMPMTLIASAVVLVVMVGAVALFYQSGIRGANEPPRVVGESLPAVKGPPIAEAQPLDASGNLQVYVGDANSEEAAPTFAAAPETPQARPAPTVVGANDAGEARSGVTVLRPASPVTEAALPPAAPVSTPARVAPTPPPAGAAPAPTRVAEATPAPATGSSVVQIGAFSSAAIANSEYAKVRAAFASYTAGRGKNVEPVERDGQTLYRTAFTGFAKADAQAFCAALKSAGRACIVK